MASAIFWPPFLAGICEESSVLVWRGVGRSGPSLWYQIGSSFLVRARAVFGPLNGTNFEALNELPKLGHAWLGLFFGPKLGPTKWPVPTQNLGADWQTTSMPRIGDRLENHATKRTFVEPPQDPK